MIQFSGQSWDVMVSAMMVGTMVAATEHPNIRQPDSDGVVVWRYMTHDKLVSLLTKRAHYFAGLQQLMDRHEGSLPNADWDWLRENVADPEQWSRTRLNSLQAARVSCWSMRDHESDALWRIYAPGPRSVALRTTYGLLRDTLGEVPPYTVCIGLVEYKDFRTAVRSNTLNVFAPVFWKRLAFEYESEVRLAGYFFTVGTYDEPPGVPPSPFVPCDLDALVSQIVISPYAADGYLDEVRAAARIHAPALESRVMRSELDTAPLF